jgi:hypothetical protein
MEKSKGRFVFLKFNRQQIVFTGLGVLDDGPNCQLYKFTIGGADRWGKPLFDSEGFHKRVFVVKNTAV